MLLQELGIEDFGIYNIVGGIVSLLSFLTGALASSSQRFFSYELGKNNGNISNYFSMTMIVYFILSIVLVIISQTIGLWFIYEKINIPSVRFSAAITVYQVSVLTFIISIMAAPFNALLISYEKMKLYSLIGITIVIIRLLLVISLIYIDADKLIVYSIISLFLSFISFLLPFYFCKKQIKDVKFKIVWSRKRFNELLSYSGWNLFGSLSAVGFNQGVNILINIFFGPTVNAARGLAVQVNSAILGFTTNINTAINPQIIKRYSSNELESMLGLVKNGSKYSFLVIGFISIPILFNTEYILSIWLTEVPEYTVSFIQLIIIDSLVCGFSAPLMTSVQATGKIKYYQIIVGGLLLLNIPISYFLLIKYSNPLIPLLVTIALSFIAFNARLFFTRSLIGLGIRDFYLNVVIKSIVTILISISANLFVLNKVGGFGFLNIVIVGLINSVCIFIFGLNRTEKKFISSKIFSVLKKY